MPGTAGHQEALGLALWTADEGRGSKLVPTVLRGAQRTGQGADALWYTSPREP